MQAAGPMLLDDKGHNWSATAWHPAPSGETVKARTLGSSKLKKLMECPAPGCARRSIDPRQQNILFLLHWSLCVNRHSVSNCCATVFMLTPPFVAQVVAAFGDETASRCGAFFGPDVGQYARAYGPSWRA